MEEASEKHRILLKPAGAEERDEDSPKVVLAGPEEVQKKEKEKKDQENKREEEVSKIAGFLKKTVRSEKAMSMLEGISSVGRAAGLAAFIVLLLSMFGDEIKQAATPSDTLSTQYWMPNLTSTEEEFAVETLMTMGANVEVHYVQTEMYDPGTVVKCSEEPGAVVDKGKTVHVYIRERIMDEGDVLDIELPECPLYRTGITMTECTYNKKDRTIHCVFKNTSAQRITHISFAAGFKTEQGESLPDRGYILPNLQLMPGDCVEQVIRVENPLAASMHMQKVTCVSETIEE